MNQFLFGYTLRDLPRLLSHAPAQHIRLLSPSAPWQCTTGRFMSKE